MKNFRVFILVVLLSVLIFVSCDQEISIIPPIIGVRNLTQNIEYETMSAALGEANEGDTIGVGPGTWNESVTLSKPITRIGYNKPHIGSVIIDSSNVFIEGFYINTHEKGITITHNKTKGFSKITIKNNTIDSQKHGIARGNDSTSTNESDYIEDLLISGNTFQGGESTDIANQGIFLFTALRGTTTITNNTFENKHAALNGGEKRESNSLYASGTVTIEDNAVLDNSRNNGESSPPPQFAMWVEDLSVKTHLEGNTVNKQSVEVTIGDISDSK